MRTKTGLTRRGFISNAALGAASIGLVSPSGISAIASYPEVDSDAVNPLRLNRNESPYGLAPAAAEALRRAVDPKASRYPIDEPKALVEAIARRFGVENDNVILGYGSTEVLKMATESFCNSSRGALVAEPTFEAVVGYCPFIHARARKINLNADRKHDLPRMLAASQGAGMIFYCNPSNPAGTYIGKQESERFIRRLPRGPVLLADEAYAEYVTASDYESCVRFVKEGLPVVVSRTFSKIYGMAGLRVGYAIGRKDLIKRMAKRQLVNNPNQLAIAASLAALKSDGEFVDRVRRMNAEVRDYVCHQASAMGLTFIPSQTNFVMIGVNRPAMPLIEGLKKRNVLVGRLFPSMPQHMRVSFGTMAEMKGFFNEFKDVLSSQK
ncbi:MAG TPA: aminotransferase class I/II-fold pyridoxal phosphate-dependent enzyme [Blastocatellia bacterium]|nr:aminotransferase class I/II-fold pyridoxal phosphate-dependent enzyme [Blastocatellia bacterium]